MVKTEVEKSPLLIPLSEILRPGGMRQSPEMRQSRGESKIEVQKARLLLALSDTAKPVPAAHSGRPFRRAKSGDRCFQQDGQTDGLLG